jgi:hypothetical protein
MRKAASSANLNRFSAYVWSCSVNKRSNLASRAVVSANAVDAAVSLLAESSCGMMDERFGISRT